MLSAIVASMSAYYHDTMDINSAHAREIFAHRIIAKLQTIAAAAYKHTVGQPFVYPRNDLGYCENLLHMFFSVPAENQEIDPVAVEALDLLFILHADHEQTVPPRQSEWQEAQERIRIPQLQRAYLLCGGPAHGGANEAVLRMLEDIGSKKIYKNI